MGFFDKKRVKKNTIARVKSQIKKIEKRLELKKAKARLAEMKNKL